MGILFFDTETTGKPINYNGAMTDLANWPRVIQLAWVVTDVFGYVLEKHCYLIKPDGWEIPQEKFWIDNGFSTETNMEKGISIADAALLFIESINTHSVGLLVAHNMKFDYNVFGAELVRLKQDAILKVLQPFCTMEASTNFCQLPGKYGWKWPNLTELHQKLFDTGFDGAHDALADVLACKDCYFGLAEKGVIVPPTPTIRQIRAWADKAAKWDELSNKMEKFYSEDEDNEDIDLVTIGEAAAVAFGYL